MIDPSDYRLIASMVANGQSVRDVADELGEDEDEVRHAAKEGARQRSFND